MSLETDRAAATTESSGRREDDWAERYLVSQHLMDPKAIPSRQRFESVSRYVRDLIAERRLTQAKAAKLLGLDQPKVSGLVRGRVEGYSIDRLFRFLNALGQRVEITVRPILQESTSHHAS